MGRFLNKRITVTGKLVVKNALHIGGSDTELYADMMLARNGRGQIYLPATSLAGPIRAWWERAFAVKRKENWAWGPEHQDRAGHQDRKDAGFASMFRIDDAPLVDEDYSEIRDHVGIDRCSGTAADGIKFDREIVPEGSRFEFCLTLEIPAEGADGEELEPRLGALLKALEDGKIRFGGAKTRGLGVASLQYGKALVERVCDKNALLGVLLKPETPDAGAYDKLKENAPEPKASSLLTITINWESVLPVMMKDGRQGFNIDMIPLTTGRGDDVRMVLTGSGIKGVIRAHSERIVRTLQGDNVELYNWEKDDFSKRIVPDDIINRLYGAKGERDKNAKYGMGAVFVEDCFPEKGQAIPREIITELLTDKAKEDKDKTLRVLEILGRKAKEDKRTDEERARRKIATEGIYPAQHNAIDRWTGGAADSALYSVLEPALTKGEIRIEVDLCRITGRKDKQKTIDPKKEDKRRKAALALLLITLRDFKSGLLPIGFGTNRGLGAIEVSSINFSMVQTTGWPLLDGELEELKENMGEEWQALEEAWEFGVEEIEKSASHRKKANADSNREDAA